MSDLNVVVLSGHIATDVELKSTKNGIFVCRFRIAVNRPGTKGKADFFDVSCWRQTAEFVSRYFRKGKRVEVSGYLANKEWVDKEGKTHIDTEIQAKEVAFGEKADSEKSQSQITEPETAEQFEQITPEEDTQLPF